MSTHSLNSVHRVAPQSAPRCSSRFRIRATLGFVASLLGPFVSTGLATPSGIGAQLPTSAVQPSSGGSVHSSEPIGGNSGASGADAMASLTNVSQPSGVPVDGRSTSWRQVGLVPRNTSFTVHASGIVDFGGALGGNRSGPAAGMTGALTELVQIMQVLAGLDLAQVLANRFLPQNAALLSQLAQLPVPPRYDEGGVWIRLTTPAGVEVAPTNLWYLWNRVYNPAGGMCFANTDVVVWAKAHDGGRSPGATNNYADNSGSYVVGLALAPNAQSPIRIGAMAGSGASTTSPVHSSGPVTVTAPVPGAAPAGQPVSGSGPVSGGANANGGATSGQVHKSTPATAASTPTTTAAPRGAQRSAVVVSRGDAVVPGLRLPVLAATPRLTSAGRIARAVSQTGASVGQVSNDYAFALTPASLSNGTRGWISFLGASQVLGNPQAPCARLNNGQSMEVQLSVPANAGKVLEVELNVSSAGQTTLVIDGMGSKQTFVLSSSAQRITLLSLLPLARDTAYWQISGTGDSWFFTGADVSTLK